MKHSLGCSVEQQADLAQHCITVCQDFHLPYGPFTLGAARQAEIHHRTVEPLEQRRHGIRGRC